MICLSVKTLTSSSLGFFLILNLWNETQSELIEITERVALSNDGCYSQDIQANPAIKGNNMRTDVAQR